MIASNITHLATSAQAVTEAAAASNRAAEELTTVAGRLRGLVDRFRV
ncbi:hypothetical protein GCM10010199_00190 [Dactylosporangium roseum]